jgi:hypothetical protein
LQSFFTCYTSAGLSSTEIIQKDDERHESNSAINDQSPESHPFYGEEIEAEGNRHESNSAKNDQSPESHPQEAEGNESTKLLVSMGARRKTTSAASPLGVLRESFLRSISKKKSSIVPANNNDIIELLSSDEENVVEQHNMQPKISTLLKKSTVKNNNSEVIDLVSPEYFAKQLVSPRSFQREEAKLVEMVKKSDVIDLDSPEILKIKLPSNEPKIPKEPMTWEDLKKITEQVQPKFTGVESIRNFKKQKAQAKECLKSLHESMKTMPNETELHAKPKYLKIDLMEHQKYGLSWMLWRERQQHPRGGILADGMVNCFIFNLRTNIKCPSIIRD